MSFLTTRDASKANVQLTALQQDASSRGFAAIAGKAASLRTN